MDPLTIISTTLPPAMATQAYSVKLQALGGAPPYTWSIVGGFGTPPTGVTLVGDTLQAAAGAIPEGAIGAHPFRVRVTDSAPTSVVADVGIEVQPYGFTRAWDFLLDPRVVELIQKYLVGGVTREKVEAHFFRDIVTALGDNFVHLTTDILAAGWTGIYPFSPPTDASLETVLSQLANDLMYFANPMKLIVSAVTPGPGLHQATFTITAAKALFIGRSGETDATMARLWYKLVDPTSDDEPHDGYGNPLTIIRLEDALGIEIDPNARPYMSDTDGFHTGKDGIGNPIGYDLTVIVEYVPNPHAKDPILPFAVRYGMREELHDISPEAFLKFANIVGDVDADIIKLIMTAPYTAGFRIEDQIVKPLNQIVELVGENGVNIEPDAVSGRIRFAAPDSVRSINGVPPAGSGDFELTPGEFIEIESEVDEKKLTIKTIIPIHQEGGMINAKALVSGADYGKFLELIGKALTHYHKHYGEDLTIGTPPDGQFQDGFIPLDPSQTLTEALDRLNEALGTVLGPVAAPLDDMDLVGTGNLDLSHGILALDPGGVGGIVYEAGVGPGSDAPYCHDYAGQLGGGQPFKFDAAAEFGVVSPGDTISMFLNGFLIEAWMMGPAVVPGPSPALVLSGNLVGMNILTVRVPAPGVTLVKLEGFIDPAYPGSAGPPAIPPIPPRLMRGYNTFQFTHLDAAAVLHTSAPFKVFLDSSAASPGGIGLPASVYGTCPGRETWVSGIHHYSGDNELLIGFTANQAYRDFSLNPPYFVQMNSSGGLQPSKPMQYSDLPGTTGSGAWNDTVAPTAFPTGHPVKIWSAANFPGLVTRLRVSRPRPGSTGNYLHTGTLLDSASAIMLYDLGAAQSTDLVETFEDEKYRLDPYDVRWGGYKYIPQMIRQTYGWKSDLTLYQGVAPFGDGGGTPGSLQINPHVQHTVGLDENDSGALIFPGINYNIVNFNPVQPVDRNYGVKFALTTVAIFDRPFVFKDTPRNNGIFRIYGITSADIGSSYLGGAGVPTGNVNLEIKVPGSKPNYFSGWMDLSKLASGLFNDGDGARLGVITDVAPANKEPYVEIHYSLNGLSTQDSGEMIILRVTLRNPMTKIYRIEEIG